MSGWGFAAAVFGVLLALAAATQPIRRRAVALALALAYALLAVAGASLTSLWAQLFIPGALLLSGYWLSGMFFRDPQTQLEERLIAFDRSLRAHEWWSRTPAWLRELLEASYAADYAVVGGGAIYAATSGAAAVEYYWTLVLISELACYVTLPWIRTRPPRAIELQTEHSPVPDRSYFRRLNAAILDSASVQANTIPSGHVAGALGAALGVMPVNAAIGAGLVIVAALIAIAAVAGRYHYVLDCVAAVGVALLAWSLVG